MSHIELSAGLHAGESLPIASSNTLTNTASMAAPSPSDIANRQQSGHTCSTSSSETTPQREMRKPRASSVRSRAAFFESMIGSPPGSSPPHHPCAHGSCSSQAGSTIPKRLVLQRSLSGPPRLPLAAPTGAGQEVEMVDQGAQDLAETTTLNQLAGYTHTCASFDAPARIPLACQSFLDIKHGTCEIQLQSAESFTDNSSHCYAINPEAKQSQTAAPVVSVSNVLDSDANEFEHGIELQEKGHAEMLEHAHGRLQAELAARDKQSAAAVSALACKTQECESLMRVVRELTENRSKLVCARTNLAEKLAEMQHEYMRLMRVADLSRIVSKENVAKTAEVMKALKQAEDESGRQQHLIGYFKERNRNLKDENLELRERLCLLERLDLLSYSRDSVCMREFKVHALKETY